MPNHDKSAKPALYGVSRNQMTFLMQEKKLSRLKKREDFECFVIELEELDEFLKNLKTNIHQIPDKTRFQLAIHASPRFMQPDHQSALIAKLKGNPGHWFLIDCYINDLQLETFVLDAAVIMPTLQHTVETINKYFKNNVDGHHYALYRDTEQKERAIQTTEVDCQTFTCEHAYKISKIQADTLFETLKSNVTNQIGFDNSMVYTFSVKTLNENMKILAPLFRGMQSFSNIKNLPKIFHQQIVSSTKNLNFEQWIEKNKEEYHKEGNLVYYNVSMYEKSEKYARKISGSMEPSINIYNYAALGFVVLPILKTVTQILVRKPMDELKNTIEELIKKLQVSELQARSAIPKIPLFNIKIPAKHTKNIKIIIKELEKLKLNTSISQEECVQKFIFLVQAFAGYLHKNNSKRTYTTLSNFFSDKITSYNTIRPSPHFKIV